MHPTKPLWEIIKIIRWVTYKPENVLKKWWIACFRTKNIQKTLDESDVVYIEKNIVKNPEKFLKHWDVLVSSANSLELLWKCCLVENLDYEATLWWFIACFRSTEAINYKFFYYFYNSEKIQQIVRWLSKKTTWIANLQLKEVENLPIPLPPLSIQQKIVEKLDVVLEKIEKNIELTKHNLANIKEQNASILEKIFKECEEEFEMKNILKIANLHTKGILPKSDIYYNYIGLENIESHSWKIIDFRPTIWEKIKSNKVYFKKWMVLYGKLRPYLNKVLLAEFDWIASTEILPIETKKDLLAPYLLYFLRSNTFVNSANKSTSWARMPRVTTNFLKQIQIPLPPLSKQQEIVAYLDNIFANNSELKLFYQKNLENLKELKQSILKEAFENENFVQ